MIDVLKPLLAKFILFAKDRMQFGAPPRLFLRQDSKNSRCALGKTAHYDPVKKSIVVFVTGRHPKDILRSFSGVCRIMYCETHRGKLYTSKTRENCRSGKVILQFRDVSADEITEQNARSGFSTTSKRGSGITQRLYITKVVHGLLDVFQRMYDTQEII